MRKYKEKFLWKSFFYSNIMIIIMVIIVFFIAKGIYGLYKKYEFTKIDYLYVEKRELEAENKLNTAEKKYNDINTDEGKEEYIRNTYSVKKEGENVVFIYNGSPSTYEIQKGVSNWQSFIDFLKKFFHL